MDADRIDQLEAEITALRLRLTRLSEASLRINGSLEFSEVLQGVLDSARSLTEAKYGVMTLFDERASVQEFLSSGMTVAEARRIWETPDGQRIFEYMASLPRPLRVPDMLGHLRSLGLPEFPPPAGSGGTLPFLAAPVMRKEQRVGYISVAEREGDGEFSAQDEETLAMFASHAGLVIDNARRYQDEQRAKADLETLINTSPVGVVVLDAQTGAPVSYNREAVRIVDGLREEGQTPEDLLGLITVRRADGSEFSLGSVPLAQVLSTGETLRAEEIVLLTPNGRRVSVLVNTTPIRTDEGVVESFVATLQDLAPIEDLERLRADFLTMVSHELRMPLTSIKGSATTALNSITSLERAEVAQFFQIIDMQADRLHSLIGDMLDVARIDTGALSVSPTATDVRGLVDEAKELFLSTGTRANLEVDLPLDLPWVIADRGRIAQVLGNLISNAFCYSPEGSPIRISAAQEGMYVAISVSDEGHGIAPGLLPHLFSRFARGGSRNLESNIDSAGLGLAICKGIVEAHGGRIQAESEGPGHGAKFTFTLQTTATGDGMEALPPFVGQTLSTERSRILVVDDDPQTLRYIRDALNRGGYSSVATVDPGDVPRLLTDHRPHLVLLDMLLPGCDGIELMGTVQGATDAPVIFLSAYGQDEAVARAFDMGAADYIVKPFAATELLARIKAALRNRGPSGLSGHPPPYTVGDLTIDFAERRVSMDGRPVSLTATEYDLLHRLSMAGGRVLTHDQLLREVWEQEGGGEAWLVRNVIKRLRRKLGDDSKSPVYIITEPRVGYRMGRDEGQEDGAGS